MDIRAFTVNTLLAGLLLFVIMGFSVGLAGEYGFDSDYVTHDSIPDVSGDLSSLSSDYGNYKNGTFVKDDSFLDVGELFLGSVWGLIKLVFNSIINLFDLIIGSSLEIFGFDRALSGIVGGVLSAIIVISVMFYAWQNLKIGK